MGFIQLKSSYFKEYTVQGNGYFSSRSVQGCIHADSTNRIIYFIHCMEYSLWVNSMVYTIGQYYDHPTDLKDVALCSKNQGPGFVWLYFVSVVYPYF